MAVLKTNHRIDSFQSVLNVHSLISPWQRHKKLRDLNSFKTFCSQLKNSHALKLEYFNQK